jgi:hypothetical protein
MMRQFDVANLTFAEFLGAVACGAINAFHRNLSDKDQDRIAALAKKVVEGGDDVDLEQMSAMAKDAYNTLLKDMVED